MFGGKNVGKFRLQHVGVLIFIDQHVQKMLLQQFTDAILRLKQFKPVDQQIVEIHRSELQLASRILFGYLRNCFRIDSGSLRHPARCDERNRLLLIGRL